MKKFMLLMLTLLLMFSFAACGGDTNGDGTNGGGTMANDETCAISVSIEDAQNAQFVCEFPDDNIYTCEVVYGGYMVYMNRNWETLDYSCVMIKDNETLDEEVDFTVDGNKVTFNVDMADFDEFDFNTVATYTTLTSRGADEPLTTTIHQASEVVL